MRGVEHHHVDAAAKRLLVALDVGLDRLLREQRLLAALDGNVHGDEIGQRLRLAVFENLEVFLLQIADVVALRVGDEDVDFDVVDRHAERRRLRSALRLIGRRRLTGAENGTRQQHEHGGDA